MRLRADEVEPFRGTSRFTVQRRLGEGGMGVVYLVHDAERGHDVALKVLPAGVPAAAARRLRREFRTLADVTHPNLVTLHELFVEDGQTFFTMEHVPGVELLDWVARGARGEADPASSREVDSSTRPAIPSARVGDAPSAPPAAASSSGDRAAVQVDLELLREAVRQLAEALCALHDAGQLHLDIKPSNVLVRDDGRVVVLDFGIARRLEPEEDSSQTQDGEISGTPTYMAPEQALAGEVSPATDWYAVGTLLFAALAGRLPFEGKLAAILLAKQLRAAPRPSTLVNGVPPELDELVAGLLEREPENRAGRAEVLAWCGAGATRPSRPPGPLVIPFVGRADALAVLDGALADVAPGRPVVVWASGASGMGKTTLVRHFLARVRERPGTLVLRGRCYEREAVPFKAFDGVAEGLARFLRRLPDSEAAALLPAGVRELAQVFPALWRVRAIEQMRGHRHSPDPQELRARAFRGLRELLAAITRQRTLVLFLDDLQWSDADSVKLLEEILAPPDPPPLLLLGSHRHDAESTSPLVRELRAVAARAGAEQRSLEVGPLARADAEELARRLLREVGGVPALDLGTLVDESQGSPLFVAELVRHASAAAPGCARVTSLEALLVQRTRALPEAARRVLELVALVGRPVEQGSILRAAARSDGEDLGVALATLRGASLVRTHGGRPTDAVECFHDRVREAVASHVEPERRAALLGALSTALEAAGRVDPELLASCAREAGQLARAAAYLERAGDSAATALAFDRAARLYGEALALGAGRTPEERRLLHRRRAEALANAGRGREAGSAYLEAAGTSRTPATLELRRLAAEQYLVSGHLEEGIAVLDELLAAVDLPHLLTPRSAIVWLLYQRARNALRGLDWDERPEAEIAPEELLRVDVCLTAVLAFTVVEPLCGAAYQAMLLSHALDVGEPHRVSLALVLEAMHLSLAESADDTRARAVLASAATLCDRLGDPLASALLALSRGVVASLHGRWREGVTLAAAAERTLRDDCTHASHHLDQAHMVALVGRTAMGDLPAMRRDLDVWLREARERGNRYADTTLRLVFGGHTLVQLARDLPDAALEDVERTIGAWSARGFQLQHLYALVSGANVELYRGEGERAAARFARSWRAIERSLLLRIGAVRIMALSTRAQAAVAAAAERPTASRQHLRVAERDARALRSLGPRRARAFAALIDAQLAALTRRPAVAAGLLRAAIELFEQDEMALHATVARRALGRLMGGDAGDAHRDAADQALAKLGVVRPEAFCRVYAPAFFPAPSWAAAVG